MDGSLSPGKCETERAECKKHVAKSHRVRQNLEPRHAALAPVACVFHPQAAVWGGRPRADPEAGPELLTHLFKRCPGPLVPPSTRAWRLRAQHPGITGSPFCLGCPVGTESTLTPCFITSHWGHQDRSLCSPSQLHEPEGSLPGPPLSVSPRHRPLTAPTQAA